MNLDDFDFVPVSTYTADQAVEDGTLVEGAPMPTSKIKPLSSITSMDAYLQNYGAILGKKAITALDPLHIPNTHELPDFSDMKREPFPAQKHVIAASLKMMDEVGSGFICGEMGTGKTLLGMTSVHQHAIRSRNQGGKNGKYRAIVLCPDHLIGKWCREIEQTIPGAIVERFGPQGGEVKVEKGKGKKGEKLESNSKRSLSDLIGLLGKSGDNDRWDKPKGAEWYVLGRNQAKWLSDWTGLADPHRGFDGMLNDKSNSMKTVIVEKTPRVNEKGQYMWDKTGAQVMDNITASVYYCPQCGTVARDKKNVPLGAKDLSSESKTGKQHTCKGMYLEMIPNPERPKDHGRDRICPVPGAFSEHKPYHEFVHKNRKWMIKECGEPLYAYTSRPYRWSLAKIVQKKLKRLFSYLIIDEVHEQKSDESAQSMACGKLIASVDHVLALTGTIIGGYANHLFPLMMRITPKTLKEEGFEWGKDLSFSETYGRIDRIITTKETDKGGPNVTGSTKSMRRAMSGSRSERKAVRPGVMPTMFGRHMIGSSMFITLDEMSDNLPDLFEYIGGDPGTSDDPERDMRALDGWFVTAVDMLPDQAAEYRRVESIMAATNKDLLQRGSMKFLGAYLWTTMDYPDRPFGWEHDPEVMKALLKDVDDPDGVPALLGQSFLDKFDHRFDAKTETLILVRTSVQNGETVIENDRIPLKKDSGVYTLDVTFNGKTTLKLIYDTGASSISLPLGMALKIGLNLKKSKDSLRQIADGSIVSCKEMDIPSVTVGKFTVNNVLCSIKSPGKTGHTVGYWDKPGSRKIEDYVGVVTPASMPEDVIYPKEQVLIDICKKQKKDGAQTWVYVQMSGKRNIQPRLKGLLEKEGLKVGILRADDVEPIEREDWIAKHGREFDVMISHPQLVSTGLDLFSKAPGGHNYSTIVFYETGYNLFTMRQAARRAWRIGQPNDCRVYYLYYKDTMQHKAMSLMSRKMAAAQALEGEFSEEGLAAMAGEDNLQMALAKNLSERIDDVDMQRSWTKVKGGATKKPKGNPMDKLPPALQLVGEAIIESQFPKIHDEIEAVDAAFTKMHPQREPEPVKSFVKPKLQLHVPAPVFENLDDFDDDFEMPELTPEILAKILINKAEHIADDPDDDEDFEMPELTPDIMAKIFANMMADGQMKELSA